MNMVDSPKMADGVRVLYLATLIKLRALFASGIRGYLENAEGHRTNNARPTRLGGKGNKMES